MLTGYVWEFEKIFLAGCQFSDRRLFRAMALPMAGELGLASICEYRLLGQLASTTGGFKGGKRSLVIMKLSHTKVYLGARSTGSRRKVQDERRMYA